MVSAHMLEPVEYLDINFVVLLFVVLCYTLLPSCVHVHGFDNGVARPSYHRTRWRQPTKDISELAFEVGYKSSSQTFCRGSIPGKCLPLGYKQQGSKAFSIGPPRDTPYVFVACAFWKTTIIANFWRRSP